MAEIEPSDRLYSENGAVFMTMTALSNMDEDDPQKAPVTFVLKDDLLVTVRHTAPKAIHMFLTRTQRPGALPIGNGEAIMLGLVEAIIDRTADALERVGNEVDGVSHYVFRPQPAKQKVQRDLQALIEKIGRKGDLLTKIQESLVSLSRMIAFYTAGEPDPKKAPREGRQRAKLIQRDASSLGEHTNFLNGKVNFLLEATLGLINLEQNKIIKIFSVAAVVMLPPTLVASVYGMNFHFMPELDWPLGYPFALGLMAISAVLPYLYFKAKRWL
jgi:magnesium transporter